MAHEFEAGGGGVAERKLTVMAWLCGDTGRITGDLRDAIRRDLDELREGARLAGESVAVVAAFDDGSGVTWSDLSGNVTWKMLPRLVDADNMADPRALMAFADLVMDRSPAEQYALIIGGHGSGPKKQDVYRGAEPKVRLVMDPTMPSRILEAEVTWDGAATAPVDLAFDDGSRQALSIADLGMVCAHIASKGPLALVLLDSCLMATVEVCEALAGSAEVLVASPEAVPGEGMPYADLLNRWASTIETVSKATALSKFLAEDAVSCFGIAYNSPAPDAPVASILAVDLKGVPEMLEHMDKYATGRMESPLWHGYAHTTGPVTASDRDLAYLASVSDDTIPEPIIDSWASISAPPAGITVFIPERGPLPSWYAELPLASRPFGQMVKRIVEG